MLSSLRGRIVIILAVLAVCVWQIYSKGLKRGLDLQGGMHVALEIDDPEGTLTAEAKADAIDRAERIIRTRIDELGVVEPLIQKAGSERLIVELAGVDDQDRAKSILNQAAFLQFNLVLPVTEVAAALPRVDRAVLASMTPEQLRELGADREATISTTPGGRSVEDLLFGGDSAAVGDSTQAAPDSGAAAADTAAPSSRPFTALLNAGDTEGAYLVAVEDVEALQRFLALDEVQRALPRDVTLLFENQPVGVGARTYRRLFVLDRDPFMTGEDLEDAVANRDPQFNQSMVQFELSRTGGRRFSQFTGQNIGRFLAIVLDNEVMSAPVIRDRIGNRGQIELGGADLEQARDLALVLRAGALPAPLTVVEERTVGPSLGADSVRQGTIAGIIGILGVIAIMIAFYKFSGLLAVLALGTYVIVMLGALAGLGANLSLPGIAGLILSIGMAVDSNVLIFERIREELDRGRATRTAVDEGFTMALSAIIDSNLTTLIAGLVLLQFGTGPVRGFAVTLSIGIVASFFSAIYVTRTLFMIYVSRRKASDPISI
jgi:protein-export membrane protein SecD